MSLIRLFVCGLLFAVALLPRTGSAANLSERLLSNNFNLYSAPFPAGNMILQDFKGKLINLSSLRGKVVILNFWKIDCPPCSVEKPILERVYRKYSNRGLDIVCVNLFDNHEKLRSYLSKTGFSFTLAYDPAGRLSIKPQKLAQGTRTNFIVNDRSEAIYEVPGVPTTYLIDRNGKYWEALQVSSTGRKSPLASCFETTLGNAGGAAEAQNGFNTAAKAGMGPVANPWGPRLFLRPFKKNRKRNPRFSTCRRNQAPSRPRRSNPARHRKSRQARTG